MDNKYALTVKGISKAYKMYNKPTDRMIEALHLVKGSLHTEFYALRNVSFDLKRGEILGIMGRNGSGKSTLLKIITGVLTPTSGEISVHGKISSLLELGTGFNMEYSGIENIYFYGTLVGMTTSQMDERLDAILSFAEIGDYVYQPVKTYSSGMFSRLAFSCAVNVDPDILIVDEILSVGDLRFQAKCFNKFKQFREQGVTILYVGHDISTMRTFCDTCMWLNNGEVVQMGDPTYVSAQYTEFMYVGDIVEFTEYKKLDLQNETKTTPDSAKPSEPADTAVLPQEEAPKPIDKRFPSAIAHWGRYTGLIHTVELLNAEKKATNVFDPFETITVRIGFSGSPAIDYKYLSVAFSIKNNEAIDLIVKTTYDEDIELVYKENQYMEFSFTMRLATGEYYLVVALEDRKNAAITYYEYIEGVQYFKVYTPKKVFGVVDVPAVIVEKTE